jgi:hypothetical protein
MLQLGAGQLSATRGETSELNNKVHFPTTANTPQPTPVLPTAQPADPQGLLLTGKENALTRTTAHGPGGLQLVTKNPEKI